jgi:hypothetical protein
VKRNKPWKIKPSSNNQLEKLYSNYYMKNIRENKNAFKCYGLKKLLKIYDYFLLLTKNNCHSHEIMIKLNNINKARCGIHTNYVHINSRRFINDFKHNINIKISEEIIK